MPQRIAGSEGWEESGVGTPGAPQTQEPLERSRGVLTMQQ